MLKVSQIGKDVQRTSHSKSSQHAKLVNVRSTMIFPDDYPNVQSIISEKRDQRFTTSTGKQEINKRNSNSVMKL